jgi:ribosomal protein S18 acetylase RimI-like enzyme
MSVIAVEDDETVGLAVGVLRDDGDMNVFSVFIMPEHRGIGIAQDLMAMIEGWGSTRGANRAVLEVEGNNDRARAFYAGFGYLPTGATEAYPGRIWLQRIELAKPLT